MSGGASTSEKDKPSSLVKKVEAVVNTASGSTGPTSPDELAEILEAFGLKYRISLLDGDVEGCIAEALNRKPDLLVVLAGDGTARAAAMAGPAGPLVAPLPGGTMNMLPKALYGQRTWQEALRDTLEGGVMREVSGGEIDGQPFYCAAMLGSPALWAPAREAMRHGDLRRAFKRARIAAGAAFSHRLRYALEGGTPRRADAISVICPLVSRALDEHEPALEIVGLDPKGAADLIRLGWHAAIGDWRDDPEVKVNLARRVRVWAKGSIPAILDGERIPLHGVAEIRFRPGAFRALVPPDAPAPPQDMAPDLAGSLLET